MQRGNKWKRYMLNVECNLLQLTEEHIRRPRRVSYGLESCYKLKKAP